MAWDISVLLMNKTPLIYATAEEAIQGGDHGRISVYISSNKNHAPHTDTPTPLTLQCITERYACTSEN